MSTEIVPPNSACILTHDGVSICHTCGIVGTDPGTPPPPTDPSGSVSLYAIGFGSGIRIWWTYPAIRPWAVAHTLLYRSKGQIFANAGDPIIVGGSEYLDVRSIENDVLYYYWIEVVTVNGTILSAIGPTSGAKLQTDDEVAQYIRDLFENSPLGLALQSNILLITDLSSAISDEEQTRLLGFNYMSAMMSGLKDDLDAIDTLVFKIRTDIVDETQALVAEVEGIHAQFEGQAATILNERAVRATQFGAVAFDNKTIQATVNGVSSSIERNSKVVNDKFLGLYAQYYIKLDVAGYVSGFGLANTGENSKFMVNADYFYVGNPSAPDIQPFTIVDGVVRLDTAIIKKATIAGITIENGGVDTLQVAGEAVVVAQAYPGYSGTSSGTTQWIAVGGMNPKGGKLFATVSLSTYSRDNELTVQLHITGASTITSKVSTNDNSNSGEASAHIPCSISGVSPKSTEFVSVYVSVTGNGASYSNVLLSVSSYQR